MRVKRWIGARLSVGARNARRSAPCACVVLLSITFTRVSRVSARACGNTPGRGAEWLTVVVDSGDLAQIRIGRTGLAKPQRGTPNAILCHMLVGRACFALELGTGVDEIERWACVRGRQGVRQRGHRRRQTRSFIRREQSRHHRGRRSRRLGVTIAIIVVALLHIARRLALIVELEPGRTSIDTIRSFTP